MTPVPTYKSVDPIYVVTPTSGSVFYIISILVTSSSKVEPILPMFSIKTLEVRNSIQIVGRSKLRSIQRVFISRIRIGIVVLVGCVSRDALE